MKIGIGIITMQNRQIHPNVFNMISYPTYFYIHVDREGKGVAHSTNECIKHLYDAGCDYIVLLDDDVWFTKKGWEDYLIQNHIKYNINQFTLPNNFMTDLKSIDGEIGYYEGRVGCFRFMSRYAVDVVGYMNTKYDRYGYEHIGYDERMKKAGLYGDKEGYPSPLKLLSYIYSQDIYNENPTPNLSNEEKDRLIKKNKAIYDEEIASSQIYYPYAS